MAARGPAGPQGPAGPNELTTGTSTSFTKFLKGNGSAVTEADIVSANITDASDGSTPADPSGLVVKFNASGGLQTPGGVTFGENGLLEAGGLTLIGSGTGSVFVVQISTPEYTDNRTIALPDASGTLALTSDITLTSDATEITGADAVTNIVTLTQAEYDALGAWNATTLYFVI
jgi:hypothetical protein